MGFTALVEHDVPELADNPSALHASATLDLRHPAAYRERGERGGAADSAPMGFKLVQDVVDEGATALVRGPRPLPRDLMVAKQADEERVLDVVDNVGFNKGFGKGFGPQPQQGDLHHDHRGLSMGAGLADEELLHEVVDNGLDLSARCGAGKDLPVSETVDLVAGG